MIAIDALLTIGIAKGFYDISIRQFDDVGSIDYKLIIIGSFLASTFFLFFLIFIVALNELTFTRKALQERNRLARREGQLFYQK